MKGMDFSTKQAILRQPNHYSAHLLFETAGKQLLDGQLTVATCNPNVVIASEEIKAETDKTKSDASSEQEVKLVVADYMICNCCQAHFADREEQLGHYKCDWHRYNLHLRLKGLPCVSEEEFEVVAGDVSSISGSDEEDESDDTTKGMKRIDLDVLVAETAEDEGSGVVAERKFHKVFFKTKEGELISLYRCLLHDKKNPLSESDSILAAASKLPDKRRWVVLMVSSGHFAGTVFTGNEVVDHKTFHRYTVRAKRGTAQSTKDGQGGAPKSAGATLRRYNEAALVQDVQDLLSKWEEHISMCDFVFIRIPVSSRGMFFGGKNPAFRKDDSRIRVIPFPTRRPTFSETKRVQRMLASVECYGQEAEVGDIIPLSPPRIYNTETRQLILRKDGLASKSVKVKNKRQPANQMNALDTEEGSAEAVEKSNCQDKGIDMDLVETFEQIDFSELKQFDSSVKRTHKKKKPLPTEKQDMPNNANLDKEMAEMRNSLFTAVKIGCLDSVQTCLEAISCVHVTNAETYPKNAHESDTVLQHSENLEVKNNCLNDVSVSELSLSNNTLTENQTTDTAQVSSSHNHHSEESLIASADSSKKTSVHLPINFLNVPLRNDGITFLHVAAKEGHADVVAALLHSGADPTIKNKDGKVPYNFGESEVRNAFRRFMAKFPDQYDYSKAQIPGPLTAEMEAEKKQKAAEKRKVKKKAMHERQKDKKATEAKVREENHEKERFLALSDREKRALAAEKRILQQCNDQGLSKPVLSRCWQCGADVTGKIPFEYFDYKFCTTKCLREHRSKPTASN